MKRSEAIVDGGLYVRLSFDVDAERSHQGFQQDRANLAHFVNQLLLYDRVALPSKDMSIVPILASWIGFDHLCELLEAEALSFARLPSILSYVGNGHGIVGIALQPGKGRPFQWWQEAAFGSLERSIELQVFHGCPVISMAERERLCRLVRARTLPIEWEDKFFTDNIVTVSYADIGGDQTLFQFVRSHEPSDATAISLNRLTGLAPNQLRVSSLKPPQDGVDLVLRVAELNLELALGSILGNLDVAISEGANRILSGKLRRVGVSPAALEQFLNLLELNDLPDLGRVVGEGQYSFADLWGLRQGGVATRFRQWLREAEAKDARDLERAYVASLGNRHAYSSLPLQTVRFALVTAWGVIEPISGTLAGVADFFLAQWLGGYSPKLFFDKVRALPR